MASVREPCNQPLTMSNPSNTNTKQLFATHSLADLASIAGKLRADVAKRDAQLATALADEYPHLLSACNTILSVKQATLNLCDATVALNAKDQGQWHGPSPSSGLVLKQPPAVPHSRTAAAADCLHKEEPFMQVLDDAWSSMCMGDFASAISHLSTAATTAPLAICQTTLTLARPLVAADFVRHTASATLSTSATLNDDQLQSEYNLVQDYAHLPDLAPTFLTHHHEAILASVSSGDTKSVDRAIRAAVHVHIQCLTQLNMPAEQVDGWASGLQSALATWIQVNRTTPSAFVVDHALVSQTHPTVGTTWSKWLADVQLTLQQDAVQAVLADVRAAITRHVTLSTAAAAAADSDNAEAMQWVSVDQDQQGGATPSDLQPLHAKVEALVAEMHLTPGAAEFFGARWTRSWRVGAQRRGDRCHGPLARCCGSHSRLLAQNSRLLDTAPGSMDKGMVPVT
ncbi:hypothetical protein BCR44DRAFT_1154345 [Catenaria anguillulae PL171]|uniref:Uncharacterized protein n=1 Tax=Catenaria anguillulae PL171 TaxID=765915 RepID=A0A1Y2HIW9_9FUNG|nr:hypothetical protein BCR44DRAFT_1154345 [Catenaria anguillulae PL171]